MDRWGQKRPLRILVPGYTILILTLNQMDTARSILITAFILGITAPPINLSVRPLWKDIVPPTYLRTAYAFDSSMMSSTTVLGPVIVTSLALSSRPYLALNVVAGLMLTGGIALAMTSVSRNWIPEKKVKGLERLLKNRAIQMLMFEGCFIGFGWASLMSQSQHLQLKRMCLIGWLGSLHLLELPPSSADYLADLSQRN